MVCSFRWKLPCLDNWIDFENNKKKGEKNKMKNKLTQAELMEVLDYNHFNYEDGSQPSLFLIIATQLGFF
jgi:hypothetical protein